MKTCPRCGFANLDTRDTCLKCRARLGHHEPIRRMSVRRRRWDPSDARRRARRLWHFLTDWTRPRLPANLLHRRPVTAACLSLVPGLGQLYNHQPLKVLWFILAWVGLGWLALWMFFSDAWAYPTLLAWLALWLWMANDALATANRINGQVWPPRHSWATAFAITTMLAVVWFVALTLMSPFAYFRLLGQESFSPVFEHGDFIWLDKWCLGFGGEPRRGELIYYDPDGFPMHRGSDMIAYDAQSFIERVIGLPGETVVVDCRSGTAIITVNGRPLAPDLYPLSTEWLPHFREFHVPAEHWLILQSRTMREGFVESWAGGGNPAPSLSGADLDPEKRWTQSCLVMRDQMIGRVFAISHPPSRRRWIPRAVEH